MELIDADYETPKSYKMKTIPSGYVGIEMSTKGKLGVPEIVYVRNFNTGDLINLSMYSDEILPERTIPAINNLIYGEVDVALWPRELINELLIKLYANFFTTNLVNINFPWDETDIAYLEERENTDMIKALQDGDYTPKIDIDITKLSTFDIDPKVKSFISLKHKTKPLDLKFISYPRFGDSLVLKKLIETVYSESDRKYDRIRRTNIIRQKKIAEDAIDLPPIEDRDYIEWQNYEADKAIYLAKATQAIYLVGIGGKDVSKESLQNKIAYLDGAEFDLNIGKKLDKAYSDMNLGFRSEVEVLNPITQSLCIRRFSFRFVDVLQAIRLYNADDYSISYDDTI